MRLRHLLKYALLAIFLISLINDVSALPRYQKKIRSKKDSLIKVWGKMQRITYFKGDYKKSVSYFDSLIDQQGVRINYTSLRIAMYCAKKARLERNFDFANHVFGKQLMSEEWHPLSININEKPHTRFTEPPIPKGGMKKFNRYIKKKLQYPESAITIKSSGTVYVQLIINKDGSIGGTCILKGISSLECNMEAERLIKNSVDWKPGQLHDKIVYSSVVIPIDFNLPESKRKTIPPSGEY